MKIRLENLRCFVEGCSEESRRALRDYMHVADPGGFFNGNEDGLYLFEPVMNSFLSGLLPDVRSFLELDCDEVVDIIDNRTRLPGPDWNRLELFGQDPAAHQIDAIRALERNTRGIIKAGTGGGKGSTAAMIAWCWKDIKWLILVHRAQLARELATRYAKQTGEECGLVAQGRGDIKHRVVFGTLQSFYSQRKNRACQQYLASIEGLMGDEVHCAGADSFFFTLNSTPNAFWRTGLSGTPFDRGDARNALVQGLFGPVIDNTSYQELREAEFVADITILVIPCRQTSTPRSTADAQLPLDEALPDWAEERLRDMAAKPEKIYNDYVAFSEARNNLVLRCIRHAEQNARLPVIVFVKMLAHGRMLAKRIERMGLRVEFVSGASETQEVSVREDMIARLGAEGRNGIDVIVGNVVLQEGIDNERIRAVVNARGGASKIATLQQTGRGSRIGRTVEKDQCWVYEIRDFGQKNVERHAATRILAYRRAGYRIVNILETDLPEL